MAGRSKDLALPAVEGSLERIAAQSVSRLVALLSPWLVGVFAHGLAAALHYTVGGSTEWVAWSSLFTFAGVLILTGVTYGQSHARGVWGKAHTTATTFVAGVWVCAVVISGPGHPLVWRLGVIGGITLALTWNVRTVIRLKGVDAAAIVSDPLALLFDHGARRAGLPIEARTVNAGEHKVEGELQLDPGRLVAEDVQRKTAYLESGAGLPPGSVVVAADPDDASKAKAIVSDPRVMTRPIIWPGPSRPGASIADPLRIGLWQDLDPVEYVLTGHHLQIMGMSGSGKSIGGCWNILGEVITRHDVAVFAIDVSKGHQTLGAFAGALHRFETTTEGARALLREVHGSVKARTDGLAAQGLQKWKPGCGMPYWLVWIEEAPDVFDAMTDKEMEAFTSLAKTLRSAGGTIVLSLQRSDYTQMPTIVRGQMGFMCFGVANSADASFGLSEAMQDAGAAPERWENAQPGMAYLGAPTIPRERIAMPMRTYAWGIRNGEFDDELASKAMRAHAEAWPAAAKEVDDMTAELARLQDGPPVDGDQGDEEDDDVTGVADEYLETEDPDPSVRAGLDDEIPDIDEGEPPLTFAGPGVVMTPEQRGAALIAHLQELWDSGARDFATRDLRPLWESTDMSRQWAQKSLRKLVEAGVLGYDDDGQRYTMPARPEV
jgi:hypothetical protein